MSIMAEFNRVKMMRRKG